MKIAFCLVESILAVAGLGVYGAGANELTAKPGCMEGAYIGSAVDDGGKMTLVSSNGCGRCVVVSAKASRCARTAADEFVEWSSKMAGARLPIVTDEGPLPPHAVVIGRTRHTDALLGESAGEKFEESEFRLKASGGHWLIVAGDDRALLYGVYETLERFGGAEFFTPDVQTLPPGDIVVPSGFDMKFSPSVAVRDPGHGFFKDAAVASRFRVNGTHVARTNNEFFRFGRCPIGWHPKFSHCHSFDAIATKEEFGATHPEYFRQGTNGVVSLPREKDPQLCLTNPDVLELAKARIAQAMREYPDTGYFGVSQMDNTRWCRCARCEAINRREGADSGTLVAFLAPLADYMATVRPDATLTTLAYHNTRNPPATLKLPKNTLVGLCVTECDFSRPLVGHPNEGNRRFVEALRKWSEISGSVYIWDYCTDYDWFAYAMPDVHALAGNIRLYADSGVSYVYESADGCPYSFFWELKGYVIAKLLWDAHQPLEPLLGRFMKAVYGPAAPHARAALDIFENYPREIVKVRMGYAESVASTNFPDALFDRAAAEWKAAERAVGGMQPFAEYVRKGRVGNDSVRLVRYVYHLACGETPPVDTPEYRAEMKAAAAEFMAIEDARVAKAKKSSNGKAPWSWGWSLDSRINLYPLIKAFHEDRKIPKRVRGKWVPGSRRI